MKFPRHRERRRRLPPAAAMGVNYTPTPTSIFQPPYAIKEFFATHQPPVPPADKFISWMSVALLLVIVHFFRSSAAPFLNPKGEPRRSASSSFYFNLTVIGYIWAASATALVLIPAFSPYKNELIAAALFFPMLFLSCMALMVGRFCVRLVSYLVWRMKTGGQRRRRGEDQTSGAGGGMQDHSMNEANGAENSDGHASANRSLRPAGVISRKRAWMKSAVQMIRKRKKADEEYKMTAFHRPFRKLVRAAAILSAALCFLYAHCWSRSLGAFKVYTSDGAGAACRAVFSPLSFGGLPLADDDAGLDMNGKRGGGAPEECIWWIWATAIVALLFNFAQDEFAGKHHRVTPKNNGKGLRRITSSSFLGGSFRESHNDLTALDDSVDYGEGHEDVFSLHDSTNHSDVSEHGSAWGLPSRAVEKPEGTLDMVPWYHILLVYSLFDIIVSFKVFLGRFDARTMQPALHSQPQVSSLTQKHKVTNGSKGQAFGLGGYPPGCVFECKARDDGKAKCIDDDEGGTWIDFVADCGDGFNSSYQVARMLAQPRLSVKCGNNKTRELPRGSCLIVGGDLAYPDPTEENYEKRFFRCFEDAMPPPPSFRRGAISMKKPALPVKGWDGCFDEATTDTGDQYGEDMLKRYKGPCAFIIPGNHDWFDGLSTYNRFILSRDWLGGWLMPQQRSYFAVQLPRGWWMLGFDLALSQDIDIDQFKFFARVAAKMEPSDACIIVTHEPSWVLTADTNRSSQLELEESNLRELMDHHLKGRVRLRLAGDLHHYTRHVPVAAPSRPIKRSRSFPHGKQQQQKNVTVNGESELNLPELIVSGGGGAFLHGTNTFNKRIQVGEQQHEYVRVCAYPNEKISSHLGWLNMWQFRWRNWRLDIVWALAYFGVASSLFPLCGIYADYNKFNPSHNPINTFLWVSIRVASLLWEILQCGRVSLAFTFFVLSALLLLTDTKLKPTTRFVWGLSHGLVHVSGALACLLFIELISEWSIHEDIVKVSASTKSSKAMSFDGGIDLAGSLYTEYQTHFSHVFDDLSPNNTTMFAPPTKRSDTDSTAFDWLHAHVYDMFVPAFHWLFTKVPLLKATLAVFDLPGTIAQKHTYMCDILCSGGTDCLLRNDFMKYQLIDRGTLVSYLMAISLYFFILVIPLAGNMFGAWLALTLNVFKAQYNEGFSSLRIQHWKNFLKLHIKDNGDMEVFALGLHRVPKRWVKDSLWDGNNRARQKSGRSRSENGYESGASGASSPSWLWKRPNKWVPERNFKNFTPEIVDFTCIAKTGSNPTIEKQFASMPNIVHNSPI